ncbi:hypothetical protein HVY71_14035 [Citrobacter freundii]|nr:hypothetical protein HVY71_14035 [Citrobacter freundii]
MEEHSGKWSRQRITYCIASFVIMVVAFFYRDFILGESNYFNYFSYVASLLTIIATLITIGEILHGNSISKSIYQITKGKIDSFKKQSMAELKLECINYYTSIIDNIDEENYQVAYLTFKHAKKIDDHLYNHHADKNCDGYESHPDSMFKLERKIFSLRNATQGKGLNPSQRVELTNDLFKMKESLNKLLKKND